MMHSKLFLYSVLLFNGLTAIAGGIGLAGGIIRPPISMLEYSFFTTYTVPGFILFVVGLSAISALIAMRAGWRWAPQLATLSGVSMVIWIIGEIVMTQTFDWLQLVYLISGSFVVMWIDYSERKPMPRHRKRSAHG